MTHLSASGILGSGAMEPAVEAISAICASLSVPRPRPVQPEDLRRALVPGEVTPETRSLVETLLTEITALRIMELVEEGFVSWRELASAAERHGLAEEGHGPWIREMAAGTSATC